MRLLLVVDANVIIAALLRDSTTRRTLFSADLIPVAPRIIIDEISRHIPELSERNSLPVEVNRKALELLVRRIRLLDMREYEAFIPEARRLMGGRDATDVPYLAAALALNADGIWSHDEDFSAQSIFRVYGTKQLAESLRWMGLPAPRFEVVFSRSMCSRSPPRTRRSPSSRTALSGDGLRPPLNQIMATFHERCSSQPSVFDTLKSVKISHGPGRR